MKLDLPQNTCAYERYDPETLKPLSAEADARLQELGWSAKDFAGKTVLDIGCNSGFLTLHAIRLGASSVHACDVQPLLVDFVSQVVAAKKLPVKVTRTAFRELRPEQDKADIVFFMEVLHWVVSQGLGLRDVIQHLTELTGELLYLEFPWSVKEPSIQKQTKLTEQDYSAEAALDELTRYFSSVRVVRFMHYFGYRSASVRVLVEARCKRREAEILMQLPGAYSLDISLSRGRNESYLLTSEDGLLVAKSLAAESALSKIPLSLCDRMFDELAARQPKLVVLPRKIKGSYRVVSRDRKSWMIFPFIGRLTSFNKTSAPAIDCDTLTDVFLQVREDLRSVSQSLLQTLRESGLFPTFATTVARVEEGGLGELEPLRQDLIRALNGAETLSPASYDGLCHGDLQSGNLVLDDEGEIKVIDLDNICVAPIYSDGLVGFIWRGFDRGEIKSFCDRLAKEESRTVSQVDITFAIAKSLTWFTAVRSAPRNREIEAQINRLVKGLTEVIAFSSST
jgi:SAM-dependent methyltransferase